MTVISRTFVSVPERSAKDTWDAIVALLAPDSNSSARGELAAVAGVACSCISDEALAESAVIVHGVGPRLRVYALYGEDAIDGERANESALSWIPTDGDWRMSIPCLEDDVAWVQAKLQKLSRRVSARTLGADLPADSEDERSAGAAKSRGDSGSSLDIDAFFRQ